MSNTISCFSGIGGLEGSGEPIALCEIDEKAQVVLRRRFPNADIISDVQNFTPPSADTVLGGWPCQDLSAAGLQAGLSGSRSRLFYELLRIAKQSGATNIVAENVPNLLRMNDGKEFLSVLIELTAAGYKNIGWRTLNAREFGLPQQRRRVFIVASREENISHSIHREIPDQDIELLPDADSVAGFYWTAGTQALSYSTGYSPTIKVGSSLDIPSPPAVHVKGLVVRRFTPAECLRLQGFDPQQFADFKDNDIYRFAGNAVARPVGTFVVDGVAEASSSMLAYAQESLFSITEVPTGGWPPEGHWQNSSVTRFTRERTKGLANNLIAYLSKGEASYTLSPKACRGLLERMDRANREFPESLREDLLRQMAL